MAKKSVKKQQPAQLVHPLAARVRDNAWRLLNAQKDKPGGFRNPHQLGVAVERAGHAAKNTIRHIFYPEGRPTGKNDNPTAPTLDSLEAAAAILGVTLNDFLDPQLENTQQMRANYSCVVRMLAALYEQCPDLFLPGDPLQPHPRIVLPQAPSKDKPSSQSSAVEV